MEGNCADDMENIIEFINVTKEYNTLGRAFKAVSEASFTVARGEFVVILGPSGAGKSTVLNLLGGIDDCTGGGIRVGGISVSDLGDNELTRYRAEKIGFVFQFYNLIPTLTALENVALTRKIVKNPLDARSLLDSVGLGENSDKFPAQLSGGEQQRVAIARAVAKNPDILLCDEPTGALDSETGLMILDMLHTLCRRDGKTVVIVTHNGALAEAADRVIRMRNGRISEVTVNSAPKEIGRVNL
jgi:putative ABC transport system ATP-binding protein